MEIGGNAAITNHDDVNVDKNVSQQKLPLDYFLLVFGLSVPIWLIGGKGNLPLPMHLPFAALVTFVPAAAASIVSYRHSGLRGVTMLWKRALDFRKIKNKMWYLPTLVLSPVIYFSSYVVMRLVGLPLPDQIDIPLQTVPALLVMYFIGDTGEELGWSGYAIDPMQNRWGALKASLLLGMVWAFWHSVPFIQTGNPPSWVLWQTLSTIPLRVLHVWIYNNTGKSVFASTLFHDSVNISWSLFPNNGSHYNPFVTDVLTVIATGIVIFAWGAKTLARYRFGKSRTQTVVTSSSPLQR